MKIYENLILSFLFLIVTKIVYVLYPLDAKVIVALEVEGSMWLHHSAKSEFSPILPPSHMEHFSFKDGDSIGLFISTYSCINGAGWVGQHQTDKTTKEH